MDECLPEAHLHIRAQPYLILNSGLCVTDSPVAKNTVDGHISWLTGISLLHGNFGGFIKKITWQNEWHYLKRKKKKEW